MKYSMQSLDMAIDIVLPQIGEAKKMGSDFNRPSLLKMAAVEFMVSGDYNDRRDFRKAMAYHVIEDALKDLNANGYMTFGDRELSEEI